MESVERALVQIATAAYLEAIVERGASRFMKVTVKPGSKTAANIRLMWEASCTLGVSLKVVVKKAVTLYGEGWCFDTFKRPWPPLSVAIGDGARRRVSKEFRPVAKWERDTNKEGRELAALLVDNIGMDDAMALVRSGWPVDKELASKTLAWLLTEESANKHEGRTG
jgi:hypothetical protein